MMMAARLSWHSMISRISPITKACRGNHYLPKMNNILPRTIPQGEGEVGGFRCNSSYPSSTSSSTATRLFNTKTDEPEPEPVYKFVETYAPATISNLGLGFDFPLGCAIDGIGDSVSIYVDPEVHPGLVSVSQIKAIENGVNSWGDKLYERNHPYLWRSAAAAAMSVLNKLRIRSVGLSLRIEKQGEPVTCWTFWTSRLRSDSIAAAAAFGVNEMFGGKLPISDLVQAVTLDSAHYCNGPGAGAHNIAVVEYDIPGVDSIAAAMIGGFVFIGSTDDHHPDIVPLKFSAEKELFWVLVNPKEVILISEEEEDKEISISRSELRRKCGQAGALVASILQEDLKRIGSAILSESDDVHVAGLIRGFLSVKKAAMEAGALGCSACNIRGVVYGPMVVAITDDMNKGKEIGDRMVEAFIKDGHFKNASATVHSLDRLGARLTFTRSTS